MNDSKLHINSQFLVFYQENYELQQRWKIFCELKTKPLPEKYKNLSKEERKILLVALFDEIIFMICRMYGSIDEKNDNNINLRIFHEMLTKEVKDRSEFSFKDVTAEQVETNKKEIEKINISLHKFMIFRNKQIGHLDGGFLGRQDWRAKTLEEIANSIALIVSTTNKIIIGYADKGIIQKYLNVNTEEEFKLFQKKLRKGSK